VKTAAYRGLPAAKFKVGLLYRICGREIEVLHAGPAQRKFRDDVAGSNRFKPSLVASAAPTRQPTARQIEQWLKLRLAKLLALVPETIDDLAPFACFALDSSQAVAMSGELSEWLGRKLSPTLLYDYPSIRALARHLGDTSSDSDRRTDISVGPSSKTGRLAHSASAADKSVPATPINEPIAIVGMACRFPGADNLAAFWELLMKGGDAITEVPAQRWDADAYYDADVKRPGS
jgi:acyl carrier protein